jgi:hypothetical protein
VTDWSRKGIADQAALQKQRITTGAAGGPGNGNRLCWRDSIKHFDSVDDMTSAAVPARSLITCHKSSTQTELRVDEVGSTCSSMTAEQRDPETLAVCKTLRGERKMGLEHASTMRESTHCLQH